MSIWLYVNVNLVISKCQFGYMQMSNSNYSSFI